MRPLHRVLIALTALLSALVGTAFASYTRTSRGDLILLADVIAVGEISELTESHYTLAITTWVASPPSDDAVRNSLRVRRFVNWTCAHRGRPYRVGERLLVFLRDDDGELRPMGGGGEGETWFESEPALSEFADAVTTFRDGYVEIGADGWIPAWRSFLTHPSEVVVRMALAELVSGSFGNRGAGDFLFDEILACIERVDCPSRWTVVGDLDRVFSIEVQPRVLARLDELSAAGPLALRPAAALGALGLEPNSAARHRAYLRVLTDGELPLDQRRRAASEGKFLTNGGDIALLDEIRVDLVGVLPRIDDLELLSEVITYLDSADGHGSYWTHASTAVAGRQRWLERLAEPFPARDVAAALERRDTRERTRDHLRYLPAARRLIPVPRDVSRMDRIAVAGIARYIRAGLAAERADDISAALGAYELARTLTDGGLFSSRARERAAEIVGLSPADLAARVKRLRAARPR